MTPKPPKATKRNARTHLYAGVRKCFIKVTEAYYPMTLYNLYLSYSSFIHTYCDGSQYNNNSYIHNYETKSVSALYFKEDATYFEANDDSEIHNK